MEVILLVINIRNKGLKCFLILEAPDFGAQTSENFRHRLNKDHTQAMSPGQFRFVADICTDMNDAGNII